MDDTPKSPKATDSIPTPKQTGMPWQFWLLVAFFVTWIVLAQLERNSDSSQRHRAAAWKNAEIQLANEVCDAYQWSQNPKACEEMANEAAVSIREKLSAHQR